MLKQLVASWKTRSVCWDCARFQVLQTHKPHTAPPYSSTSIGKASLRSFT